MDFKIEFNVEKLPLYFVSHKNGVKSLEVEAFDGGISVFVRYDYDRKPLGLNAEVSVNDKITVVILDPRIELYVNGELKDEEWAYGNRLFNFGDEISSEIDVKITEYIIEKKEETNVIGTFENAEGWYPGNGVFVGDCMPYVRDNEYHVFYLKDRHHHGSKWSLGGHQWEHISTKDFKTWSIHPMAVPLTTSKDGSICTGSWIKDGDKEYAYYTVRMGRGIPAPIRRSVSYDGYHFTRDESFGFTIPDKYRTASARDPKVIKGKDGLFHMFLTTALIKEDKGCLAHYVSKDMEKWEDFGKPLYISETSDHPECPDYFEYNGKYYLVFSIQGVARYMVSDKPFEGFVMPDNPIIPCESVPKCAEWQGKLVFTGFKRIVGYAGSMTFKVATANEKGELVFENLE